MCEQVCSGMSKRVTNLRSAEKELRDENRELRSKVERLTAENGNLEAAFEVLVCEDHRNAADLHDQHQKLGGECLFCTAQELLSLERQYTQRLGEMARLCDTAISWLLENHGNGDAAPDDVLEAANEVMEYVEAVRP